MNPTATEKHLYERIYAVVRQIPAGKVASYGQIAQITGGCTARMVGYAMAATPENSGVPWHRVINAQGKISLRADSFGSRLQEQLLKDEGVEFDAQGRVDLERFGWLASGKPSNSQPSLF
jgi:methylated-DNA-protein-cysteine methyltransferase-like protein